MQTQNGELHAQLSSNFMKIGEKVTNLESGTIQHLTQYHQKWQDMENGIHVMRAQMEQLAGQTTALQAQMIGGMAQISANLTAQTVAKAENSHQAIASSSTTPPQNLVPQGPNLSPPPTQPILGTPELSVIHELQAMANAMGNPPVGNAPVGSPPVNFNTIPVPRQQNAELVQGGTFEHPGGYLRMWKEKLGSIPDPTR